MVDVGAVVTDTGGHERDGIGPQGGTEHHHSGSSVSRARVVVGAGGHLEGQAQPVRGHRGRIAQRLDLGADAQHQGQGEVAVHDDLLDVEHLGPDARDGSEQGAGDPGAVPTGDGEAQGGTGRFAHDRQGSSDTGATRAASSMRSASEGVGSGCTGPVWELVAHDLRKPHHSGVAGRLSTTYSFWKGSAFAVDGQRVKPNGFLRNRLSLPGVSGAVEATIKGGLVRAHPTLVLGGREYSNGAATPIGGQVLALLPVLQPAIVHDALGFLVAFGAIALNMSIIRSGRPNATKAGLMVAVLAVGVLVDVLLVTALVMALNR